MAVNLKIVSQVVASGTPGPAGKSAYQIAVDNGFEGTESEWLKSGLSPFKGWYDSVSKLESKHANPTVGEYAYIKGATSSDPVKIYECSTEGSWSDSGRTVDTSTVQTFRSGEAVNDVDITDDSSEILEDGEKIPTAGAVAGALGNAKFSTGEKVKNVGIDDEPTAGSENLVKSGGVENRLIEIESKSLFEIVDLNLKNYALTQQDNFGRIATTKHACIPVIAGDVYFLIAATDECRYAFAISDESSEGAPIPFVAGTNVMVTGTANTYNKITIPNGCSYLLFNAGGTFNTKCYIYKATTDIIKSMTDEIPINGSHNLAESGGMYNLIKGLANELYDLKKEPYVISINETFEGSTYTHDVIPVTASEVFFIENYGHQSNIRYAFATSDESEEGDNVHIVEGTTIGTVNAGDTVMVLIPLGCKYLLINDSAPYFKSKVYRLPSKFASGESIVNTYISNKSEFGSDALITSAGVAYTEKLGIKVNGIIDNNGNWNLSYKGYSIVFAIAEGTSNLSVKGCANGNTAISLLSNYSTPVDGQSAYLLPDSKFIINSNTEYNIEIPTEAKFLSVMVINSQSLDVTPLYIKTDGFDLLLPNRIAIQKRLNDESDYYPKEKSKNIVMSGGVFTPTKENRFDIDNLNALVYGGSYLQLTPAISDYSFVTTNADTDVNIPMIRTLGDIGTKYKVCLKASDDVGKSSLFSVKLDIQNQHLSNDVYNFIKGAPLTEQEIAYIDVQETRSDTTKGVLRLHYSGANAGVTVYVNLYRVTEKTVNSTVFRTIDFVDGRIDTTDENQCNFNVLTSSAMKCAVVKCEGGDTFTLSGTGGKASVLYSFVDASGNYLFKSDKDLYVSDILLTAPPTSKYLVVNVLKKSFKRLIVGDALTEKIASIHRDIFGTADLNELVYGNNDAGTSFWFYPPVVSSRTDMPHLFYTYMDKEGYTGIADCQLGCKDTPRTVKDRLKLNIPDTHNCASVMILPDGRLLVAYVDGHNAGDNLYVRISHSPYSAQNFSFKCIKIGVAATYTQIHFINNKYYIFVRAPHNNAWGYVYSEDLETWSAYTPFLQSDVIAYVWFKPVSDSPNILKFITYTNPDHSDPSIRMGYVDFQEGNIYNSDGSVVGTLGGGAVNRTDFTVLIPIPTPENSSNRMFDLAVTPLSDTVIAFCSFNKSYRTDSVYKVYRNGVIETVCNGGYTLFSSRGHSGMFFIDENRVAVTRAGISYNDYDYVEIYEHNNGEWVMTKEIYKEMKSPTHKIRNFYPLVDINKKYIIWCRGSYETYYDYNVEHSYAWDTDVMVYDIENDRIINS